MFQRAMQSSCLGNNLLKTAYRGFVGMAVLFALGFSGEANANDITVSTTSDVIADDGLCSLREAVIAANTDAVSGATDGECSAGSGADTIYLTDGATYLLTLNSGSSDAEYGDLDISGGTSSTNLNTMTITVAADTSGDGDINATIDAGGSTGTADRVIYAAGFVSLTLSHLTIQNGYQYSASAVSGGGINVSAYYSTPSTLTLDDVIIKENKIRSTGSTAKGAGLFLYVTTLTMSNSVVMNNDATAGTRGYGGGIYIESGSSGLTSTISGSTVSNNSSIGSSYGYGGGINTNWNTTITNSAITSNTASSNGGAINNSYILTLANVTVSGNTVNRYGTGGGGIYTSGSSSRVKLSSSTIAGNTVVGTTTGSGGGIYIASNSALSVKNSILADNSALTGSDCFATVSVTSYGYNLLEQSSGCTSFTATTGDVTGQDPALGALADNGGLTQTMAISAAPALNTGSCTDVDGGAITTDQRGYNRDANCDVGAYEYMSDESANCSDEDDNDGDGFTDAEDEDCGGTETDCSDGDDDDGDADVDCDDEDCLAEVVCGGSEDVCDDSQDNDEDGSADCDDTDCATDPACVDNDGDGFSEPQDDCDDANAAISPAAIESCNHIDDDCDGATDDGAALDNDGDGIPNCDDSETCDGIDNDGDSETDESVKTTFYRDSDGDGHGDSLTTTDACSVPAGYATNASDCDDASSSAYPGGSETCGDGIDQDCDGNDTACAGGLTESDCADTDDNDNDAFADCEDTDCVAASHCVDDDGDGYSEDQDDCDDADPLRLPTGTETCNDGIDQDCSGADTLCESVCDDSGDDDGDGDIDCDDSECAADTDCIDNDSDGFNEVDGDCNDTSRFIYPGASETCGDGRDQDCDGSDSVCMSDDTTELDCDDDADNDGDGNVDCNDSDCEGDAGCLSSGDSGSESPGGGTTATESNCINGIDDDADTSLDCDDSDCFDVSACQTDDDTLASTGAGEESRVGGCQLTVSGAASGTQSPSTLVVVLLALVPFGIKRRFAKNG